MTIYDFKVKDTKHEEVSMDEYKGKVMLIVNTATGCGFTPQYDGLSAMYDKYRDRGFEVLDFPCNQFLNQAPGTDEELASFCKINFGTKFKTFAKINVNGKDAEPLFTFLKNNAPNDIEDSEAGDFKKKMKNIFQSVVGKDIKWNFTKFLVDREGNVVGRFAPTFKPEDIEEYIIKYL
ncbi:MAG: glutathione peroxidase [Clostridiaceae bacterium]|nr:glutathione peroxidase [Clostridiaceae bacterium]